MMITPTRNTAQPADRAHAGFAAMRSAGCAARPGARAFTIIELLVVTAIIILLLSILIIAVNSATKASQVARTRSLMDTIRTGLIRFKEDVGYYPPILGVYGAPAAPNDLRRLYDPNYYPSMTPAWPDNPAEIQRWYSSTSLAEYLIGYGHHGQDGYGRIAGASANFAWNSETPPLGIRHPGTDGAWGAGPNGNICNRMGGNGTCSVNSWHSEANASNIDQGKVLGPYVEMKDQRLLASVDGTTDAYGNLNTFFPGEAGYNADNPKVIVDFWGKPIRYYRRPYPRGGLTQSFRAVDRTGDGVIDPVPTLSDWYFLRPFSVKPGTERSTRYADAAGDRTTSAELDSAEFALFSTGPDLAFNRELRVDPANDPFNSLGTDLANRDNILEVSP